MCRTCDSFVSDPYNQKIGDCTRLIPGLHVYLTHRCDDHEERKPEPNNV